MCLDSPCVIDNDHPDKAQCTCALQQGLGDYLVLPGTDQCTKGAISSATVGDLEKIGDFLETPAKPPAPDITVKSNRPKEVPQAQAKGASPKSK
jgi:hypothetical protein